MEEAENMGVKVDWFNNVIVKILKATDHQESGQKVISINGSMEVLSKQLDTLAEKMKEE